MNDTTKDAAIAAARKNELHASHGTMEVKGEADKGGNVDVLCGCGVMLRVGVNVEAPAAKPAESPGRHVPRRVNVTDETEGG